MKSHNGILVVCSILVLMSASASLATYPDWSTDGNTVHVAGVAHEDPQNRVVWDNDYFDDVIDFWLLWGKAAVCEANLVANIVTVEANSSNGNVDTYFPQATHAWNTAQNSGWDMSRIPYPIKGSHRTMNSPTDFVDSAGARKIVEQANLCSPEEPLFIHVGGQISTVAAAYLLDNSIADKVLVFQADPYAHNGKDYHARQVVQQHLPFLTMTYDHWWPAPAATGDPCIITQAMVDSLKNDPVGQWIRTWKASWAGQDYGDLGDGGGICWMFGQHTWNNMTNNDGQTKMIDFDPYQQGDVWYATVGRYDLDQGCNNCPPENLEAQCLSSDAIELTWIDNCDDETGFVVERRPYHGSDSWHVVGTVGPNTTHFTDTMHLHGSVVYTYRAGTIK